MDLLVLVWQSVFHAACPDIYEIVHFRQKCADVREGVWYRIGTEIVTYRMSFPDNRRVSAGSSRNGAVGNVISPVNDPRGVVPRSL